MAFTPGQTSGRSNTLLRNVIDELAQRDMLLGKHIKSLAPIKPVTVIEYESLIFEEPPESAVLKSIRNGSKNLESTVMEGPNCNKAGYKNVGLWSPRSINLEQLMKPLLNISVATWPDYETFNEILSQADMSLEGNLQLAMVDTLLVRMNEAHEVRYGFDRLYSHWSYGIDQFEVRKEWVDKIELDILVLSLINDHTASLQLKKEQDRLGGMQRQTQSHTSATASATLSAASKIHKIVSALGVNPNSMNNGNVRRKVLSEGECRTHAVLKAVCRDGSVHIRPLCTSGDVLLALHELLDPIIFIHGCIQLPHVLSDIFARHTEGFYRYTYTINQPGQWQYLRIVLPTQLQWLNQFVQPAFVDTHSAFHIETIPSDSVPQALRDVSIHITRLVVKHYGKAQLLQRMVVDFEACMDISKVETKTRKKRKTNKSTGTHNTTGTRESSRDLYGANIPAPHMQSGDAIKNYHFRLLHISEMQLLQCWAGQRRDAVCYMHPATKIQLRNFDAYFHEQWELRKREYNKQKAEQFMSQQSGSIKHIANPSTAMSVNLPGVLNLNTKSIMFGDSASPMNNNTGRGTLRVSSYTPFSPFAPVRSVRIDSVGSFSPIASNRGSMLRPGSTISTKGIPAHTLNTSNRQSIYDTSSAKNTNTSSKDNTFIREMMSNPRSAKMQNRKPDIEADPAKLDAIHLVNLLFDRKYKPIVVKKRRVSVGNGSSDDESEFDNADDSASSTSEVEQSSGSDSDDVSKESSEEEDAHYTHNDTRHPNTVFQFVQRTLNNTNNTVSPRTKRLLHTGVKSEKVTFALNNGAKVATVLPQAPLSRTAGAANFNISGAVRGTGTIIKQALMLTGQGTTRISMLDTTPIVTTSVDAAILAKYHVTEKIQSDRERRRAEERRVKKEAEQKILEEKQQAEQRRQAGNNSLYFVTRTNIKSTEVAPPGSPGGTNVPPEPSGSPYNSPGGSGMGSRGDSRTGSPNTSAGLRKGMVAYRAARALSLADAQRERRRNRRGATQSLDIGAMDVDAAQVIFDEDERRYRETIDQVGDDYLDSCETPTLDQNITHIHNTRHTTETTVDKELYFAVDTVARHVRAISPDKPNYKSVPRTESLSPSKMYAEHNKTPPTDTPTITIPVLHSKHHIHTQEKTRNDVEFNDRAYKLAAKIDLTYLVTSFNPANHSRDKTIILDEDTKLPNAIITVSTVNTEVEVEAAPVELTPAERRAADKAYAAYMAQLYNDEMSLMMDKMVEKLPDQLASKVKKALAAQQLKNKLKRRKEFINRRRKIETILPNEVNILTQFYENQSFKDGDVMTDSSSEDEATKRKNNQDMNTLLGDFAMVDEATMQAMLAARAAEEQAERDAAEAKRVRRESYLSRKEAEAQAREDKRCADLAAAAAAAEDAVYAGTPDAPTESPISPDTRKGSAAQMRKTIRTYSLMQITKVLLDGTLVPEVSSKNKVVDDGSDSDKESERSASRPITATPLKRLDENGNLVEIDETNADGVSGLVRPRSRPQSQPFSRPSLWGLPPLSWRGNSVLLSAALDDTLHEENSEVESSVHLSRTEATSASEAESDMCETENISDIRSLKHPVRIVRSQRSHRDLVIGALGHDLDPPRSAETRETEVVSEVVPVSEDVHVLAAVAVQNILGSAADIVLHAPTAPVHSVLTPIPSESGEKAVFLSESQSTKEHTPRRKLSFSVKVPTAVVPRVLEASVPALNAISCVDNGIQHSIVPDSNRVDSHEFVLPVGDTVSHAHEPPMKGPAIDDLIAPVAVPVTVPPPVPLHRQSSVKDSTRRPIIPVPDEVHIKAAVFEEPSITSTLTGPECEYLNEFSRENSAEFDLHDVQDLLRTVHRPETMHTDAFVHRRHSRVTVSNSIMKSAVDGRPPTGLLFNMVKPATPSKPSPMDKISSLKGLPLLKKHHKKSSDTSSHTKTTPKARTVDLAAVSDDRELKLSDESKPHGLYLIPGAAVASFVQKPPSEKPSRPIVYTTRVMMQQKIREYMSIPMAENLTVSTLTLSEQLIPTADVEQDKVYTEGVHSVKGHGYKSALHDSDVTTTVHILGDTGVVGITDSSACDLELSGELAQTSGVLVDDSCHNITTTKLSTYDRTDFSDSDSPDIQNTTTHTNTYSNTHTVTTNTNQIESEGQLRLDAEEWQLILNAAREQAHDLDLDIIQHTDIAPFVHTHSTEQNSAPIHFTDEISEKLPSSAVRGVDSVECVLTTHDEPVHVEATADTLLPWRLARLGEENFNWRVSRGERSVVLEKELDDSENEVAPDSHDTEGYAHSHDHTDMPHASYYGTHSTLRRPVTLEELLVQLGVVPPYKSPTVSPSTSPGRTARNVSKNVYTPVLPYSDPPSVPEFNDTAIDESILHITKPHYAKKPDPPPHRPPYVRPSSAQKVKKTEVKQVAVKLPNASNDAEAVQVDLPIDDIAS